MLVAMLVGVNAFAANYKDGVYRGYYLSRGSAEVEVQFELRDDVISKPTYRLLAYKGNDWLKEEEFVKMNKGYMGILEYLDGKKAEEVVLDKLLVPEEIEKAGATVRGGKVRHAVKMALTAGPMRLLKEEGKK